MPTVGVTHRPLLARGDWAQAERAALSPLLLREQRVGYWLRTKRGCRPPAIRAAWRTDAETAVEIVLACTRVLRTGGRCDAHARPRAPARAAAGARR